MYVSINGYVYFNSATGSTYYAYIYSADLITSRGVGNIYYRKINSSTILSSLKDYIINLSKEYSSFTPKNAFVVTWAQVPHYSYSSSTVTFQFIIVTDDMLTFVFLNYGTLNFPSSAAPVSATINIPHPDSALAFTYSKSSTLNICDIAKETNVNLLGRHVFKVNGKLKFLL